MLSKIAKIEPQSAYCCFVSGYTRKSTYIMRTIPNIGHLLKPVDDVVYKEFITAISRGITVNRTERKLQSLPAKYGGLRIPILSEMSIVEYNNSTIVTKNPHKDVIQEVRNYIPDTELSMKWNNINSLKTQQHHKTLETVKHNLLPQQNRLNELNQNIGASSWLTTLPLKGEGYVINIQSVVDLQAFTEKLRL